MFIKERILQIAEFKDITKQDLCKKMGVTYGNFTGKNKNTPINSDSIANLLSIFPDISARWLLTGEGEMLRNCEKNEEKGAEVAGPGAIELIARLHAEVVAAKNEVIALKDELRQLEIVMLKNEK